MRSLQISGAPLEAGVPEKIRKIKDKGEDVYKEKEIESIRELRNEIVHRGTARAANERVMSLGSMSSGTLVKFYTSGMVKCIIVS